LSLCFCLALIFHSIFKALYKRFLSMLIMMHVWN